VAKGYGLDIYPNQLEIITAEQMMDAYASHGMPVNYRHWSYGKHFMLTERATSAGRWAWPMRSSSTRPLHRLPDGREHDDHAGPGHRPRGLWAQLLLQGQLPVPLWTDASAIIDYLVYARNYIADAKSAMASNAWKSCWTPAMR
jgi:hypothetical protein